MQQLRYVLDCLFPIRCLGQCGCYDTWLCADCFLVLPRLSPHLIPLPDNASHLDGIISCLNYHNQLVENLVQALKYYGARDLAGILAEVLRAVLIDPTSPLVQKHIDYIIPVPLAKRRYRWRGFNQSALLARHLSVISDIKTDEHLLRRRRETVAQVGLNFSQRWQNVAEAFLVDSEILEDKTYLLIDDVLTTGATLDECAKALKKAGAKAVFALTVAHGTS